MQQLPKESVSQMNSDLIITSVWDITREALENSLDAKATSIKVDFFKNGVDALIISDDGRGISPEGLKLLGKQGVTSKMEYQMEETSREGPEIRLKYQGSLGFRVDSLGRRFVWSHSKRQSGLLGVKDPRGRPIVF